MSGISEWCSVGTKHGTFFLRSFLRSDYVWVSLYVPTVDKDPNVGCVSWKLHHFQLHTFRYHCFVFFFPSWEPVPIVLNNPLYQWFRAVFVQIVLPGPTSESSGNLVWSWIPSPTLTYDVSIVLESTSLMGILVSPSSLDLQNIYISFYFLSVIT